VTTVTKRIGEEWMLKELWSVNHDGMVAMWLLGDDNPSTSHLAVRQVAHLTLLAQTGETDGEDMVRK